LDNLRALFTEILSGYGPARREEFRAHALAILIRERLPEVIRAIVPETARYIVKASPGNGRWAEIPWAAIFDALVTKSAQSGHYLVYLFKADLSGVYLSLNQGVTALRNQYRSGTHQALAARSRDFQSRLGPIADGLIEGKIDLASYDRFTLGADYEAGAIYSLFYPANNLPSDDKLEQDLRRMLALYGELVARDERLFPHADMEDDEHGLGDEDLRTLREHKRIERNRDLATRAKKFHGYVCKVCGFDFEKQYGPVGHKFIEAHHLVPLAKLRGQIVALAPEHDFTVLCANCHRMIHRTELVGDVREFRAQYLHR